MELTRCTATCRREYMICEFEKTEREKQAEKERREKAAEPTEECSCSCEALEGITERVTQLQSVFRPGDPIQANELKSLSTCFQSCMTEFLECQQ